MKLSYIQIHYKLLLWLLPFVSYFCSASEPPEIKLGMSTALSGPAKQIGEQLYLGSQTYFDKLNKNGGINGSKINLIVADDGYEPRRAVNNTHRFIQDENVLALFGAMGTPTSHAVSPILEKLRIPYLMPFSGADFLHLNPTINVFNTRASYYDEAKVQIKYLVEEKKHTKIGFLIQADEFGYVVETGLLKSLSKYNLKPIKVARYLRNTHDVDRALKALKRSGVTAICLVGTYSPLSKFINTAYEEGFKPDYTSISFASSPDLFSSLKYPTDLMVTEVVPNPAQCDNSWCKEFLSDMRDKNIDRPTRLHFEGYLNAVIFGIAATSCKSPLEAKCLMSQLDKTFHENKEIHELFTYSGQIDTHKVYRSLFSLK
ncbi:ABC transporter substrate-binding protein [Pseudoalteromonas atlantica]|uniref:ABC transporter substrate-binding protein n=1 Tax=Pseudoalteromonas atlantica TaxID=288 RepID=UPI003735C7D9